MSFFLFLDKHESFSILRRLWRNYVHFRICNKRRKQEYQSTCCWLHFSCFTIRIKNVVQVC